MQNHPPRLLHPSTARPALTHARRAGWMLAAMFMASPLAHGASIGTSAATIDWASVTVQPDALTSFDVFDAYGNVQVDANIHGIASEVRIAQSHQGQDSNITVNHDAAASGRSVHLAATTDLVSTKVISATVSNESQYAGSFVDNSTAQYWIYVVLHGLGNLNVQADYALSVSGAADDPNRDASPTLQAWAGVGLFDESDGVYYAQLHDEATDVAAGARSGHFAFDILAPTERVLRLYFETNALSIVSSTPVPLPASLPLALVSMGSMALIRRRRTEQPVATPTRE